MNKWTNKETRYKKNFHQAVANRPMSSSATVVQVSMWTILYIVRFFFGGEGEDGRKNAREVYAHFEFFK